MVRPLALIVYVAAAIVDAALDTVFVTLIAGLALLLPSIAVTVRRLHDTGRSGWWYLIGFVPFVGSIVLLVFMFLDSEHGPNRFGPSPKYARPGYQSASA